MNVVFPDWDGADARKHPSISLRSGNLIDDRKNPVVFDASEDFPSEEYLDNHIDGLAHLDSYSWICYIPYLMKYTLKNYCIDGSNRIIDGFLYSLKMSDIHKKKFLSLNHKQVKYIILFLKNIYLIKCSYLLNDLIDDWEEFRNQTFPEK